MKAKYSGKCRGCDAHFSVGAEIERRGACWYLVGCKICAHMDEAVIVVRSLEERMKENHQVLCGYDFGHEYPGYRQTSTRQRFLEIAIECGEATEEEAKEYKYFFGIRGMQWDFAD